MSLQQMVLLTMMVAIGGTIAAAGPSDAGAPDDWRLESRWPRQQLAHQLSGYGPQRASLILLPAGTTALSLSQSRTSGGGQLSVRGTWSINRSEAIVIDGVLDEPAWAAVGWSDGGFDSRRRDCHFADALSASILKHLLKVEGGVQHE